MNARVTSVVGLSLVVTAGLSASLAAGDDGVTGTPSGWKQHDSKRPSLRSSSRRAAGRGPRAQGRGHPF